MPCCDYNLPSSRTYLEDFEFSSTGPIKPQRKKWSVTTSETISIIPPPLATNRSSVTKLIVNRNESFADACGKTSKVLNQDFSSIPSSPGRYKSIYCAKNSRNFQTKNIVSEIRSRSLVSSPQTNASPKLSQDLSSFQIIENTCLKRSIYPKHTQLFEFSFRQKSKTQIQRKISSM